MWKLFFSIAVLCVASSFAHACGGCGLALPGPVQPDAVFTGPLPASCSCGCSCAAERAERREATANLMPFFVFVSFIVLGVTGVYIVRNFGHNKTG